MSRTGQRTPVIGPGSRGRRVVAACIVVTCVSVTTMAFRSLGGQETVLFGAPQAAVSAPASVMPAPQPTEDPAADAEASQAAEGKGFAAPATSAPPQASDAPTLPKDPNDVGVLVAKEYPLEPTSYEPSDLVNVAASDEQLRKPADDALKELSEAARADGVVIQPLSGYRSAARQDALFTQYSAQYGEEQANRLSAKPGHSEHQTGLAIDVGSASGRCALQECFGDMAEGKYVAENAAKYGFIVRYPRGQESHTGYKYEPWHLRFVGKEIAKEMKQRGDVTLEAYYGLTR